MEKLRVVDKYGNNTEEILEREQIHNQNKLHNEITVYIVNKEEKVLLERRSSTRRFSPNKLGLLAGHVLAEESPKDGAIREIKEEIGLSINKEEIYPLQDKYLVKEPNNNHFMYPFYLILNTNKKLTIQKEEVTNIYWYTIDEIIDMINNHNKEIVFTSKDIKLFQELKQKINTK